MACAYRKGLSVEPGWRGAVTKSRSGALLSRPLLPTQASVSPLSLSSTSTAPSCTWRPASSRSWRCSSAVARRCSGAESALRSRVPGALSASRRWARCGAMPSLGAQRRCCMALAAKRWSTPQPGSPPLSPPLLVWAVCAVLSGDAGAFWLSLPVAGWRICASSRQARRETVFTGALGDRTRAAASAASRSSSPCAALLNSERLRASMPIVSPRNGTRLRYASRIWSLRQRPSSRRAAAAWPNFCNSVRPRRPCRKSSSISPTSCMLMVEAPRVFSFHKLPQAAALTARQSTPLCS